LFVEELATSQHWRTVAVDIVNKLETGATRYGLCSLPCRGDMNATLCLKLQQDGTGRMMFLKYFQL